MSKEDDNKKVVIRFMETFGTGKVDDIMNMMADSATWWVGGTLPMISGTHTKAAFRKLLEGIGDSCTGPIKLMPKEFTAQGDRVAVETESLVQAKNGRTYNNFYHFLFEVKDGKIAKVKEYLDTMHTHDVFIKP
ncbi:MAG: nuclear transport factor 2 family protein [Nevskia sp.]|nr:nuclear transport factor 2 family protein [Nevskia sp.]